MEVLLKNGRTLRGIELFDEADGLSIYIKNKSTLRLKIARKDIKSRDVVELTEADLFTAEERYKSKRREMNPATALEWYNLALFAIRIKLYDLV